METGLCILQNFPLIISSVKSEQILWVVNLSPYLHIKTFAPHETKVQGISHIAFMGQCNDTCISLGIVVPIFTCGLYPYHPRRLY